MSIEDVIIRHLQGRTSPEEDARVELWRRSSPENEAEYDSLSVFWSLVEAGSPLVDIGPPPDVELVIARGESTPAVEAGVEDAPLTDIVPTVTGERISPAAGRWTRGAVLGTLAASIAILGFGLWAISSQGSSDVTGGLVYEAVTTGADAGATVTLYNGTAVRLAPNSQIQVIEAGENPVVRLRGRAFFGVVPNPTRTFTVVTDYGQATALGTRFEVRADERELQVRVLQGNVRVSSAGSAVEIGEGMMTRNAEGAPPSTARIDNVDTLLDWIGHTLMFRATPLTNVISEIERGYGVRVELANPSIADLEVTATFSDQPVENVVYVVCRIVEASCAVNDDGGFRIGVAEGTAGILGESSVVSRESSVGSSTREKPTDDR